MCAGQAVLHGLVPVSTTSTLFVRYSGFHLSSVQTVSLGVSLSLFLSGFFVHNFCPKLKALVGQFSTHSPQATHLLISTLDT